MLVQEQPINLLLALPRLAESTVTFSECHPLDKVVNPV